MSSNSIETSGIFIRFKHGIYEFNTNTTIDSKHHLSGLERLSRVDLYLGDKGSDSLDATTSSKYFGCGFSSLANE